MAALRVALLVTLLLPACSGGPDEAGAAAMRQALATTRASLAAAGGGPAASPSSEQAPALPVQETAARLPAGPRLRGTGAPSTASALVGASAPEARRMLGEPSLRRPEGEAEIWLYEAAECRLDVVLYPERDALVVAHAAARAHGAAALTEAACLASVAAWTGGRRRT